MKFSVQVGKEFPCYEAQDSQPPVVVHVTNHLTAAAADVSAGAAKKRGPLWAVLLVVALVTATVPATLYGVATGDYSTLKSIAEASRDVLQYGAKYLK
jgi:hypothetical protein